MIALLFMVIAVIAIVITIETESVPRMVGFGCLSVISLMISGLFHIA